MAKERTALEQLQEEGQQRRTNKKLELVKDPVTGNYKAKLPISMAFGSQDRPALVNFEFTEEDLATLPGLMFIREGDETVGAYVEYNAGIDYARENYDASLAKPARTEVTPEEEKMLREGEVAAEQQEYAYRQGRVVNQKNIDSFVQIDPVTRQVYFITSDTPSAEVVGGTAEGGIPSPTFAVIIPSLPMTGVSAAAEGASKSIVYDASVVQDFFTNDLIRNNRVAEFKQILAEKGFYSLAGIGNFETQSSLRQGATADEFFGIALNRYLNELSQQNYQNIKDGLNPFGIEDYANTVQPDLDALSAYVPSDREAEAVLKSTYSQYVGRMPSAEEVQAFKFALEAEATNNPRRSAVDMVSGMQTTYEGFTADQLEAFATEYTLDRPEAEEFGAGQGGLNAISNVFERIVNNARQEVQSVVRPGSL